MRPRVEDATRNGFTPISIKRVTALGASLVWQGREHQVTRQGGIDGNGGCFQIADFSDHDHIRCLTENGTQGGCEGQAYRFADLHLVDAGQQILHGVFDGDDFASGRLMKWRQE